MLVHRSWNYRTGKVPIILIFIGLMATVLLSPAMGADLDNDGIEDDIELSLANKFAPILQFEEEETVFPVAIGYHLNNSNLNQSRPGDDLTDPDPSITEIGLITDPDAKFYLDNRLGNISNDGIVRDYQNNEKVLGYTVYARVINLTYESKLYYVLQYWMFYAFNQGPLNTHEGDWEMVQIVLDEDQEPVEAMFSQHTAGERTAWSLVEKDGTHPMVFIARGSHANYFKPYQGKLSLSNDKVADNGKNLENGEYSLILLGEKGTGNHLAEQDWLDYAGRWGEYGSEEDELRGKRGPYGPVYREDGAMWDEPMDWGRDLSELNDTIFKINWFFYNFVTIFILLAVLGFTVKILRIIRSHHKVGLGKRIFSILYIDGPNLHTIGNLLTIAGIALAVISLFHPWYSISVDIDAGEFQTDGMVEIVSVSGEDGVLVNTLESNSGMIQVFSFPLPFSFIIGLGIFFLILGTVGVQKSKALGRKYRVAGIKFALPIFIILLFVGQASNLIGFAPIEIDEETDDLVDTVSSTPWEGEGNSTIGEYGNANVKWGLEQGGWYLLYAGALLFVAGILQSLSNKDFYGPDPKSQKTIQNIRQKIEGLERELDEKKVDREFEVMNKMYGVKGDTKEEKRKAKEANDLENAKVKEEKARENEEKKMAAREESTTTGEGTDTPDPAKKEGGNGSDDEKKAEQKASTFLK